MIRYNEVIRFMKREYNNKFEGTFTDLKKNLNNHSGMTKENRMRFIARFSWQ